MLDLRRSMLLRSVEIGDKFHATEDAQAVRNEVYGLIQRFDFDIDATILEKSKAQPQARSTEARFYKYAWYYHAKRLIPARFCSNDNVLVTAAALGTNNKRAAFKSAFNDVMQQTGRGLNLCTAFAPSANDPCLQVADYCAWAIQRKWELNYTRSYGLIGNKVRSEFDLWQNGTHQYY